MGAYPWFTTDDGIKVVYLSRNAFIVDGVVFFNVVLCIMVGNNVCSKYDK